MRDFLWLRIMAAFLCLVFILPSWAADPTVTIEPYTKDEFPSWLQDLRRAEIVSLGSLPFATLSVTLGYSLYRYFSHDMNPDYFPNPFAKSSSAAHLSTDEQLGILFASLGISAAVGVIDFTVSSIQRHLRKKEEAQRNAGAVEIIPLDENGPSVDDAEIIPLESVGEAVVPANGAEGVPVQNHEEIPLVEGRYREFPPFGLFVPVPAPFWGAAPDA